jgi:transcriptional regulator with XRE-family HTH domain
MKQMVIRIEALRKKRGWSQEELARRLGVSYVTYNRWKTGKVDPSPLAQQRIKAFLRRSKKR